jgi:glucose/arabinose dehydrogenase
MLRSKPGPQGRSWWLLLGALAAFGGAALLATIVAFGLIRPPAGGSVVSGSRPPGATPTPVVTPPPAGEGVALELVVDGLDRPLALAFTPDGRGLFVGQQAGRVEYVSEGEIQPEPAIDLTESVLSGGELGMLGLALHPDFVENGLMYVSYIHIDHDTVLAEYELPDRVHADPGSVRELLRLPQENDYHKGGALVFDADGLLFMSIGDDAWPRGTTPDYTQHLRGTVIRIDVDGRDGDLPYAIPEGNAFTADEGPPEVFDYGLRNPWRMSIDAETGELWIADVGSERYEEVDRHPPDVPAGIDFGWGAWEGFECRRHQIRSELDCDDWADAQPPVLVIEGGEFASGDCAVIGGYVYRGDRVPGLTDRYVFGDYCSGRLRVIPLDEEAPEPTIILDSDVRMSTFGMDPDGELYVADVDNGQVWRLVST